VPKAELLEQEWSHFFDIADLNQSGSTKLTIEASEDECEDLARRFSVEAISQAKADLELKRESGIIHVMGRFYCTITQNCVVSLEAFETELSEEVEGWFADKENTVSFAAAKKERDVAKSHAEVEILDEKEDPEAIIDGVIDLGEFTAQHISLAIPPYPHKDGVKYEVGDDEFQVDEKSPLRKNPFEALKDWKKDR
jgi:hypothetical protein